MPTIPIIIRIFRYTNERKMIMKTTDKFQTAKNEIIEKANEMKKAGKLTRSNIYEIVDEICGKYNMNSHGIIYSLGIA